MAPAAKFLLPSRHRLRYHRPRLVAAPWVLLRHSMCQRSMPQSPRSRLHRPILSPAHRVPPCSPFSALSWS